MKIEKINENQLRFTLTREDLESRNIKISELAYGSEKARKLFRDLMKEAVENYNFQINNIPLMVEAIPVSSDSIILIVTKVGNPEELDSRFSHFTAEKKTGGKTGSPSRGSGTLGADDILNLISEVRKAGAAKHAAAGKQAGRTNIPVGTAPSGGTPDDAADNITRFFLFHDLDTVIRAAGVLSADYQGPNSLYKNEDDGNYYLIVRKGDASPEVFNRVCNILCEYASQTDYTDGMEAFFREHMSAVLTGSALQTLRVL